MVRSLTVERWNGGTVERWNGGPLNPRPLALPAPRTPECLPRVRRQQPGQEKVHPAEELEHRERNDGRQRTEHELLALLRRRRGRVGHHEEREKQRRVQIRRAIERGDVPRVA